MKCEVKKFYQKVIDWLLKYLLKSSRIEIGNKAAHDQAKYDHSSNPAKICSMENYS